jgi:hypothetical protein
MKWSEVPEGRFVIHTSTKHLDLAVRWTVDAIACGYVWDHLHNEWTDFLISPDADVIFKTSALLPQQLNQLAKVGLVLKDCKGPSHNWIATALPHLQLVTTPDDSPKTEPKEKSITDKVISIGTKDDQGKPQLELLPPSYWGDHTDAVLSKTIALFWFKNSKLPETTRYDPVPALEFGAKKYSKKNWYSKNIAWSRFVGAFLRHCNIFEDGVWCPRDLEELDEESGLPHGMHAECCLVFLREYMLGGLGQDDRQD